MDSIQDNDNTEYKNSKNNQAQVMEELLSMHSENPREEIVNLLASAILRGYYRQRSIQEKEQVRLDKPVTSCMTVNTAEKNDGD